MGRGWNFSGPKILFTKQTPTHGQCSCALSLIDDDDAIVALDVPRKLQGQYGLRPRWGLLNSVASKIGFLRPFFLKQTYLNDVMIDGQRLGMFCSF